MRKVFLCLGQLRRFSWPIGVIRLRLISQPTAPSYAVGCSSPSHAPMSGSGFTNFCCQCRHSPGLRVVLTPVRNFVLPGPVLPPGFRILSPRGG